MSDDGWHEYVRLARRLDAVRSQESARTAGMREGVAEMSAHADELADRLRGQGAMLTRLAGTLRLRRPRLDPIAPAGAVDPPTALAQVAGAIDRGDREAQRAAERGHYAGLLPGVGDRLRSVLVYGGAAAVILVAQLLTLDPGHLGFRIWVDLVIPAIGFVAAYFGLRLGGRARVADQATEIPVRLGFTLCFVVGPVVQILLLLRQR
jgi:hypothetical protein